MKALTSVVISADQKSATFIFPSGGAWTAALVPGDIEALMEYPGYSVIQGVK